MKSKTSFFNKTVFLKNATLYWPIWSVYTILLLILQPFVLWGNFVNVLHFGTLTANDKLEYLSASLYIQPYVVIIACMAVVTGMAVYSYLYNSKSANMIHSLPVDRTQLFGTNVISGLAFLAVPQILTFFVTLFLCLGYGVTHVEYLAIWLLICFAIDFIFFGMVTFCAFFTGQLVAMPIYIIVLNSLSFLFYSIVEILVNFLAYGVNSAGFIDYKAAKWFSPYMKIYDDVKFTAVYSSNGIEKMELRGGWYLFLYLVLAAVLFTFAYFIYQKRHIEQAGDLITVGWVKPIFRWGVGTFGGFFCSIYISMIFEEIGFSVEFPVFIILLLAMGVLFYFVADMFVQKNFRVFKKKNWKQCGIFTVCLLATFGALYGYVKYEENYIPDRDEVKSAYISYGYTSKFTNEDMQIVFDIHEEILKNKTLFKDADNRNYSETVSIRIGYELKDKTIKRTYTIPLDVYDGDMLERLMELEMDADNFLRNKLNMNYEDVTESVNGSLNYEEYKNDEYNYVNRELTAEQCKKVFEAIIADTKAGAIQKYNSDYMSYYEKEYDGEVYSKQTAELLLTYYASEEVTERILNQILEENGEYRNWYYDQMTDTSYYVNTSVNRLQRETVMYFGEDCTNVLNALVECGILTSADDIRWDYEY